MKVDRLILILLVSAGFARADFSRPFEPIVLTGAHLPALVGTKPTHLAAFRYNTTWEQIPLQIDERKQVDSGQVRNKDGQKDGATFLWYADSTTHTGADDNPLFDADDELVVMARDGGPSAPEDAEPPPGVLAKSRMVIAVKDPSKPEADNNTATFYLFKTDGSLPTDAGKDYVSYEYKLKAGPYLEHFNLSAGPNPEDSIVKTAHYRTRFTDRWVRDEFVITSGDAGGIDILDLDRMASPTGRGHNETRWSEDEEFGGAFVANIDGPIRAIRSYLGAGPAPLMQRQHIFYEQREEVALHLRLMGLPSGITFHDTLDYNTNALGMTYQNNNMEKPVTIDGKPDEVPEGEILWELVTGKPGSLIIASGWKTDIPGKNKFYSYYQDEEKPIDRAKMYNGDDFAYGNSGPVWQNWDGLPNTDPRAEEVKRHNGVLNHFALFRTLFYAPPGQTTDFVNQRMKERRESLEITISY